MGSIKRLEWCAVLLTLSGVIGFARPAAAEVRAGDTVIVDRDEVIDEDLYLIGGTVRVDGKVRGDLVVTAGNLEVNGEVDGDLLSAAGQTMIAGVVTGSVRAVGGSVTLTGSVDEDFVTAAADVALDPEALIGRDAVVAAGEAELRAPIERNVAAACGSLLLASHVAGDVDAIVGMLEVDPRAKVLGTLEYRSNNIAKIPPTAEIAAVLWTQVESDGPLSFFYRWMRAIVGLGALGLILALLSPRFARAVPETLKQAPLKSMGWGALSLLLTPIAAVLLFIVGGMLGGWWLGLIALAALLTALAISFPVIGYYLGIEVISELGSVTTAKRIVALLAGLAVLTLLIRMPVLGGLAFVATVLFGLGALLRTGLQLRKQSIAA